MASDNRSTAPQGGFDEFLAAWRGARLQERLHDLPHDELRQRLERRAGELAELALRAGYRSQLAEAARPYRTLAEFVKALHDTRGNEGAMARGGGEDGR